MPALATRTEKATREERCALACGPLSVSTASSRSVTGRSLAAILPGKNRLAVSAAENRTVCQPCLCRPLRACSFYTGQPGFSHPRFVARPHGDLRQEFFIKRKRKSLIFPRSRDIKE